jgi:polysaccharide pyruvyl transferase WcaK-like protein
MPKQTPTKISFFGNFGTDNIGNEATLQAIVARTRESFPECALSCICSGPQNVTATHKIAAVPHTIRSARIWDREVPPLRRAAGAFAGITEELREYGRAWRTLAHTDLLIVPGTGLLNDAYALSGWGPYGLLKWTIAAKLRRSRVMFVSVGAGPVRTLAGKLLLKAALVLADYRSYRDLVFDLAPGPQADRSGEQRPVVALGLMRDAGAYGDSRAGTYTRYLQALATFAEWVLHRGYDIKLVLGDADEFVLGDFRSALRERLGTDPDGRVEDAVAATVDELVAQLAAADLVVATRFHNVLLSIILGRPVIAIAFHPKSSSLMSELGVSEYCHDMATIDGEALITQFERLERNADAFRSVVLPRIEELQRALDDQYTQLFRGYERASRSIHAATAAT